MKSNEGWGVGKNNIESFWLVWAAPPDTRIRSIIGPTICKGVVAIPSLEFKLCNVQGAPPHPAHQRTVMDVRRCPVDGPALQIAALSTSCAKRQNSTVKGLKRKLEDTTLDLERARMEREDFRQGGGPSDVWCSPASNSDTSLLRIVESLQDVQETVRVLLKAGRAGEAREFLDSLDDPEGTDSEAEDAQADAAAANANAA